MSPPAGTEAAPAAGRPSRLPSARRLRLRRPVGGSAGLSALAATVLAGSVLVALDIHREGDVSGTQRARPGTAFLGTATCADWQRGDARERSAIVGALASAATGPDPESAGATLDEGEAYLLLGRACSTRLSRSFLLYEIYNRAAAFRSGPGIARAPGGAYSGALSH